MLVSQLQLAAALEKVCNSDTALPPPHIPWLLLLPSSSGLAQRYAETEAEVFNALLSKIQDSTALRDYIYESLLTMKARTC